MHDYTNRNVSTSRALADSRATVSVYLGSALLQSFHVPGGTGTLWTVFELGGGTLTPVNTMGNQSDPAAVQSQAVKAGLAR